MSDRTMTGGRSPGSDDDSDHVWCTGRGEQGGLHGIIEHFERCPAMSGKRLRCIDRLQRTGAHMDRPRIRPGQLADSQAVSIIGRWAAGVSSPARKMLIVGSAGWGTSSGGTWWHRARTTPAADRRPAREAVFGR